MNQDQPSTFTNYYIDGITTTDRHSLAFNSRFNVTFDTPDGQPVVLNRDALAKRPDILGTQLGKDAMRELDQIHQALDRAVDAQENLGKLRNDEFQNRNLQGDVEKYRLLDQEREKIDNGGVVGSKLKEIGDEMEKHIERGDIENYRALLQERKKLTNYGVGKRLQEIGDEMDKLVRDNKAVGESYPAAEERLKQDPKDVARQMETAQQAIDTARLKVEATEKAFSDAKKGIRASENVRNAAQEQKAPAAAGAGGPEALAPAAGATNNKSAAAKMRP